MKEGYPQALKRGSLSTTRGTNEFMPFPNLTLT